MQRSLAVEGELPEDGLAAYGDDGDDLMMVLARKIVRGDEEDEAETVEEVFAQARNAEATAEELLVDDGWKPVDVERETVAVNRNGVSGNGHAAVPVNRLPRTGYGGNRHHEEADEPQQTLFSWAEFIAEEPVKPRGRSRKPQPSTASLFERAMTLEQEREAEPGRRMTLDRKDTVEVVANT